MCTSAMHPPPPASCQSERGFQRSLASINPLLAAAERNGDAALALRLLAEIHSDRHQKLRPSTTSYAAAIGACVAGTFLHACGMLCA